MPEIGALRRCVLERELRFPHIETSEAAKFAPAARGLSRTHPL